MDERDIKKADSQEAMREQQKKTETLVDKNLEGLNKSISESRDTHQKTNSGVLPGVQVHRQNNKKG